MCSQGYVWQSQKYDSYQKGVPAWVGKRRSGFSICPSGKVLAWLLLPKRVFKCQFSYIWKSFGEVGLSQLLCVDWLLAWNVVSSQAGPQQFDTPMERASRYELPGATCFLCEAISGFTASVAPHRSLGLQWWAIPPYCCLIREAQVDCSLC